FILGDFFPVGHRQPVFFDQSLVGEKALTVSAGVRDESATDVGAQCDWDATKNDGLGVGLGDGGKGRIASDPALLNLPRPLMVGALSVPWQLPFHGSNEQIFGAEQQIPRARRSDQRMIWRR